MFLFHQGIKREKRGEIHVCVFFFTGAGNKGFCTIESTRTQGDEKKDGRGKIEAAPNGGSDGSERLP